MKQNKFGELIFNEDDIIDSLMSLDVITTNTIRVNYNLRDTLQDLRLAKYFTEYKKLELDVAEYDIINQSKWLMPDEYKDMDISEYVLFKLCNTTKEMERCGEELLLYQEHELLDLLCYLKYIVDVMRKNNIVWGVGRGSSVSSYVLYKIGIHKIDSMLYNLSIKEFLR